MRVVQETDNGNKKKTTTTSDLQQQRQSQQATGSAPRINTTQASNTYTANTNTYQAQRQQQQATGTAPRIGSTASSLLSEARNYKPKKEKNAERPQEANPYKKTYTTDDYNAMTGQLTQAAEDPYYNALWANIDYKDMWNDEDKAYFDSHTKYLDDLAVETKIAKGYAGLNQEIEETKKDYQLSDVIDFDKDGKGTWKNFADDLNKYNSQLADLEATSKQYDNILNNVMSGSLTEEQRNEYKKKSDETKNLIDSITEERDSLQSLQDFQNALAKRSQLEYLRENGTMDEYTQYAQYVGGYANSTLDDIFLNVEASQFRKAAGIVTFVENVKQLYGEKKSAQVEETAKKLYTNGEITGDEMNELFGYAREILDKNTTQPGESVGLALNDIANQLALMQENGESAKEKLFVNVVGNVIDNMASQYGPAVAFGNIGMKANTAVMAFAEYAPTFQKNMEEGYTLEESMMDAGLRTGIEFVSELIGGERILNYAEGDIVPRTIAQLVWEGNKSGVAESVEEGLGWSLSPLAHALSTGEMPSIEDWDPNELKEAVTTAYLAGFLQSGLMTDYSQMGTEAPLSQTEKILDSFLTISTDEGKQRVQEFVRELDKMAPDASIRKNITLPDGTKISERDYISIVKGAAARQLAEYDNKSQVKGVEIINPNRVNTIEGLAEESKANLGNSLEISRQEQMNSLLQSYNAGQVMETISQKLEQNAAEKAIAQDNEMLANIQQAAEVSPKQFSKWTAKQKLNVLQASGYAKALNLNVGFDDSFEGDGYYDPKTKKIMINPNSEMGEVSTMVHELTHLNENSRYYKDLKRIVEEEYKRSGKDIKAAETRLIKEYAKHKVDISKGDLANREFVAIEVQSRIGTKEFVEKLIRYNENLAYRIFKNIQAMTTSDVKTQLENTFMQAFRDVQTAQTKTNGVITDINDDGYYDYDNLIKLEPIEHFDIKSKDLSNVGISDIAKMAVENAVENGAKKLSENNFVISAGNSGRNVLVTKETYKHRNKKDPSRSNNKENILLHIGKLIKGSVVLNSATDNGVDSLIMFNKVGLGGDEYIVRFIAEDGVLKKYDVLKMKAMGIDKKRGGSYGSSPLTASSYTTIKDLIDDVKQTRNFKYDIRKPSEAPSTKEKSNIRGLNHSFGADIDEIMNEIFESMSAEELQNYMAGDADFATAEEVENDPDVQEEGLWAKEPEGNYIKIDDGYVSDGKTVGWKDSRIKEMVDAIANGEYSYTSHTFRNLYAVNLSPREYRALSFVYHPNTDEVWHNDINYDPEYYNNGVAQPERLGGQPWRMIDQMFFEGKKSGINFNIVSQEGNHRAIILDESGYSKMPVILASDKPLHGAIVLRGMGHNDETNPNAKYVDDYVPIDRDHYNELIRKFGSGAGTDFQYSFGETNNSDGTTSGEVKDQETLDFLENQGKVKVYRAMSMVDGKLIPPMSERLRNPETGKWELRDSSEIGKWYRSEERPELIKNGKFGLRKQSGGNVDAAYNPYFHTSLSVLNDQFTSAYTRPNMVVVEGEVPASELESGYQAPYAKDSVGKTEWHSGTVSSKLKEQGKNAREVILSRWFKPTRVLSDTEVAEGIRDMLSGTDVEIPFNVVTPGVRSELENLGVPIGDSAGMKQKISKDAMFSFGIKGSGYYATVAPYLDTQLTEENRQELIDRAEAYYDAAAKDIADYLGIELTPKSENIGGYKNEDGKKVRELSWTYDLGDVSPEQAKMFASLMGDLAYENQEAVISLRYLNEGEDVPATGTEGPDGGTYGREYGFKYKDLKTVEDSLKKAGITDYNIDRKTNYLTVQDFGFDPEGFPKKLEILLEGNNYDSKEEKPIYSYYLSREDRRNLYETRRSSEEGLREGIESDNSGPVEEAYRKVSDVIEKKASGQESPFLRRSSDDDLNISLDDLEGYQTRVTPVTERKYNNDRNIDMETGVLKPKAIVELETTIGKTTHEAEIEDGQDYAGMVAQQLDAGVDPETVVKNLKSGPLDNGLVRAYYTAQVLADRGYTSEYREVAQWARDIDNLGGKLVESTKILYSLDDSFSRAVYLEKVQQNLIDEYKVKYGKKSKIDIDQTINDIFQQYYDQIIGSKTAREFSTALGALVRKANAAMPKTAWDRITQYRMWAMLSGTKTATGNLVSNLASLGLYRLNGVNQALLESALKKVDIKRVDETKTYKIDQSQRNATFNKDSKTSKRNKALAKEVWKQIGEDVKSKYGEEVEKIPDIVKKNILTENKNLKSPLRRAVDTTTDILQRVQNVMLNDAPVSRLAFIQKFDELAQVRGINVDTIDKKSKAYAKLIDDAYDYAEEVVSHNATDISNTLSNIQKRSSTNVRVNEGSFLEGLDKTIKNIKQKSNEGQIAYRFLDNTMMTLQKWFIPFYKTNASIMQKSLQYSPLEWVQVANDFNKVKNGRMDLVDLVEHMSKAVTGTELYILGAIFAYLGWLKWDRDDEDYSGRLSVKVPGTDKGYTVDFIDPASTIFAKGVVLAQDFAENGLSFKTLHDLVNDYEDIFLSDELDMFSSMKDFFDTVGKVKKGEDDYGEYTLSDGATDMAFSILNSYIPAIVRDISRIADPAKKVVYDTNNKKYLFNRLLNSTPFRNKLVDKKDATGNTITYTQPFTKNDVFNRILTQMVSRGKLVDMEGNTVQGRTNESQLGEKAGEFTQMAKDFQYNDTNGDGYSDTHWIRETVPANIYPGGNKVELNPEERDTYGKTWTDTWTSGANALASNDVYKGLDYEKQADVVYELQAFSRECIEAQYCKDHDLEMTDAQKTSYNLREFCTINGKVDGYLLSLVALGNAKENKNATGGQQYVMGLKDKDGKTIKNSRQLRMRQLYEDAGIYDEIVEAIHDGKFTYADFGLSKTVVEKYSKEQAKKQFEDAYKETMDNAKSNTSGGKKSGRTSKKKAGKISGSKKAGKLNLIAPVQEIKPQVKKNNFVKAYADTLNKSKKTSTDSGGSVVCPKCGNRVSSGTERCPVCGTKVGG